MDMKARFEITLTRYMWECGDGCCSDSGFKVHTLDHEETIYGNPSVIHENYDWDSNRSWEGLLEESLERIEEILGRIPKETEDYLIVKENEDRGGVYESDFGF